MPLVFHEVRVRFVVPQGFSDDEASLDDLLADVWEKFEFPFELAEALETFGTRFGLTVEIEHNGPLGVPVPVEDGGGLSVAAEDGHYSP